MNFESKRDLRIFDEKLHPMENLAMIEFRRQIGEYINQTYYANKAFVLTKGEKKVAALVPISLLNRLTELEALHDQTLANQDHIESATRESTNSSEVETA